MSPTDRTPARVGAGTAGPQRDRLWIGGWAGGSNPGTNPDQARAFLRWLEPTTDVHAFRVIHDSDKSQTAVKLHGTLDQLHPQLERMNADGFGVFVMANATDGAGQTTKHVTRVRACFADLDGMPLPDPHAHDADAIVWTSAPRDGQHARAHLYYRADVSLQDFRLVQLGLSDEFRADDSVHDLPRVMRLPGYVHGKNPSSPYQVRAWWLDHTAPARTVQDFRQQFPAVDARFRDHERAQLERQLERRQRAHIPPASQDAFLNAWGAWFQRESARIGTVGRHDLLRRAARHLLDNRLDESTATAQLLNMLPSLPTRDGAPVPDSEARAAVRWTFQNLQPGDPWKLTTDDSSRNLGANPNATWTQDSHPWAPERSPFSAPSSPFGHDRGAFGVERAPWDGRR